MNGRRLLAAVAPEPTAGVSLSLQQWWRLGELSRRLASRYCQKHGDHSCDWYHGLRPYWRALDLLADPSRHQVFFEDALRPLAVSGRYDRVLISGSADFAMPALVMQGWAAAGRAPRLTVLDWCATPLLICRWYMRQRGYEFQSVLADVREHRPLEPYDLIVSHSFFPQFPPAQRAGLIVAWHRLLRPGGKVVTVTRIRAPGAEEPGFIPLQAVEQDAFVARLRDRLKDVKVPVSEEKLLSWARHYAARRRNYTVRDPAALIAQIRGRGFTVCAQEIGSGRGRDEEWRRDGARPDGITYLAVTATRAS